MIILIEGAKYASMYPEHVDILLRFFLSIRSFFLLPSFPLAISSRRKKNERRTNLLFCYMSDEEEFSSEDLVSSVLLLSSSPSSIAFRRRFSECVFLSFRSEVFIYLVVRLPLLPWLPRTVTMMVVVMRCTGMLVTIPLSFSSLHFLLFRFDWRSQRWVLETHSLPLSLSLLQSTLVAVRVSFDACQPYGWR